MHPSHRAAATALLLALGALAAGSGCVRRATVVLDGVPEGIVRAFERTRAVPADDLALTSLPDGAVIPRNHAFPLFEWSGARPGAVYLLELRSSRAALDVFLTGTSWRPEGREFMRFLSGTEVRVRVFRTAAAAVTRSETSRVVIARRPLGDRIAFRVVQPLFEPAARNALDVFAFGERRLGTVLDLPDTCIGCHVYTRGSAMLNLKRFGDRRMVSAGREGEVTFLHRRDLGAFSFLATTPDGRFAAYVHAPVGDLVLKETFIEPFDYPYAAADIWVLELASGKTWPLPGASSPGLVQDMPSFSPDGSRLIFSRYRMEERDGVARIPGMELAEVPFNEGRGGEAHVVPGTSGAGRWHWFARYSPDGRWISFCRGDGRNGIYARKTSDIYLMSVADRKARRLNANAEGAMDSWHSWSSDSRWIAFSSNREARGMTALYLTHVDEDGNDSPPVKLVGFDAMKVNTPQFVPPALDLEALEGLEPFIGATFGGP